MDDQSRQRGGDETWFRLREWTKGLAVSERLAATLLQTEGYTGVDPSHPLGGRDGGKDGLCKKDGLTLVYACYFPRGQQGFKAIEEKLVGDFAGVARNGADGIVFVSNQELTLGERKTLQGVGKDAIVEIYHLERLASVLNTPKNYGIRFEYLDLRPTDAEYVAFMAAWDEKHVQRLQEVNGRLDVLLKRMEEQTADMIGYATGGDSVAYLRPRHFAGEDRIFFNLVNQSQYPVFDIKGSYYARMISNETNRGVPCFGSFEYPAINPGTESTISVFSLDVAGYSEVRIEIAVNARSCSVSHRFRAFRDGDSFIFAESTKSATGFSRLDVPPSAPGYDPADPDAFFLMGDEKQ